MSIKVRTKRRLMLAMVAVTVFLAGGLAFVSYFMHAVYEPEEKFGLADLPAPVREAFAQRFPDASEVEWKSDEDLFEATFEWQGREDIEAYFDPEGGWSKTEFPILFSELPEKARAYLNAQGFETEDVEQVQMPDSPVAFEVQMGNKLMEWDCLFDAEGNLVSRIRDGPVLE